MFLADEVRLVSVADLVPYARNSRTHSESQIAALAASMREFGFTNPVLVRDDGTIMAGHGRVMAAQYLGMEHVPCISLGHLSDAQARAYVLADNRLAELYGWDDEMLAAELHDISGLDFDIQIAGFDESSLGGGDKENHAGQCDEDAAPEKENVVVSMRGDVVFDPFGGSGTTLISSEKNNRIGKLIEIDPGYVDVIVRRWQEFTGRDATLEGDGRTFNQIADYRGGRDE